MEENFYKTKNLMEMSDEEWEALCDGCGKCCFRKFIEGHGKKTRLYYTCIACDLLDLNTGLCSDYENRFKLNKECTHLTKKNVKEFSWLPDTCAYRLLYEKKELPEWHPLISKDKDSVKKARIQIKNGIHEKDVEDWEDYILNEENIGGK
ncbi:MAG: YcgN family cysteine cluster protein [Treponema sp.]|nr:YcgN family cysteine cluster protein [Candidatus Treponema equifaecale]